MNPRAVSGMVLGEVNRPGKIAGASVTTAVHQTAHPAKGMAQRDAGREDVGDFPEGKLFEANVKDAGKRRADQAAVKDQAAAADIENLPQRLVGEVLAPIREDVQAARADDGAEDQPWTQVDHRLGANSAERRAPSGRPESGEQTERDKNAV